MILTYGFTVLIIGTWVLKTINDKQSLRSDDLKRLTIKRTPLDIPLLLFLGANILSTIFSIDIHTSIWGYYSRSNGGLLSIISYLLLYWAYCSNMDKEKVLTTLKFALASGAIVSLYAISEHFGISPSCISLRGEFNASCWIQDVQSRVFATLGQPNWLAAYLSMLIFPSLYFYLSAVTRRFHIIYYTLLLTLYSAFTFTYSRGPTLGLIGGMAVFLILFIRKFGLKSIIIITIISFILINFLFGSALTSFRLISKFAAPVRPTISLPPKPSSTTQLENGGTESGQIRFIVWQGALDIFKHNPIFGSGLETFAYSYYQYRPQTHNLTSEWDFLYNKAHNEYLNYLATTGILGLGTYILLIGSFVFWSVKKVMSYELRVKNEKNNSTLITLTSALLAAYISYLIYNFFLFSVVAIAIFFYLFPALVFVTTESTKAISFQISAFRFIYKRPSYTQAAKVVVVITTLSLLYSIFQLWYADTLFNLGEKASEAGNPGRAYNLLAQAVDLNSAEPFYKSELAFSAAQASSALKETEATLSAALKNEATVQMAGVLKNSPKNVSFWRSAVRTYFELATIDPTYIGKTLTALDTAISLAPTDPKLYYNKALILDTEGKKDEEIKVLQMAITLKPNYLEALQQLKDATQSAKP